jgi:hypothetical protein
MLLVNALWDLVSCLCIWNSFGFRFEEPLPNEVEGEGVICSRKWQDTWSIKIAEMHTNMWTRKEDASNYAASMLMASLVFAHFVIRLYAAIDKKFMTLAVISYAMEGFFFLMEALKGTMETKKAYSVCLFSFLCMLFCISNKL